MSILGVMCLASRFFCFFHPLLTCPVQPGSAGHMCRPARQVHLKKERSSRLAADFLSFPFFSPIDTFPLLQYNFIMNTAVGYVARGYFCKYFRKGGAALCGILSTLWTFLGKKPAGCFSWPNTLWITQRTRPTAEMERFWPPCSLSPAPAPG